MTHLTTIRQALKRVLSLGLAVCAIATGIWFSFPAQATALNEAGQVVKERAKANSTAKPVLAPAMNSKAKSRKTLVRYSVS